MKRQKNQLLEILRDVEPVPGGQIQTGQVESQLNPRGLQMEIDAPGEEEAFHDRNPDARVTHDILGRKQHPAEY